MENKPRYSRLSDILELLTFMQSKTQGVTLGEIQEKFNISRRTAERMRDSVLAIFPQIDEIEHIVDRQKRWGFVNGFINELITFTPEELANLEKLKELQNKNNLENSEVLLESTIDKLKALSRKTFYKLENDLEILLQTEGYAVKQTPRYKIDISDLSKIREAIKKNKKVSAVYKDTKRILSPLGFIYGEKIYLIAIEEIKSSEPRTYIFHKLSDILVLEDTFERDNFDLKEYSERSFGVFQGEILNVELKFSNEVASEVLCYFFHPTQKIKQNEDGTVTVKFKASGEKEILWHLFKWGNSLEILSPKKLRLDYINELSSVLNLYKKS